MQAAVTPERLATIPAESQRLQLSDRIKQRFLSEGFEDGFFTPCKRFDQIPLGGYRDFSGLAYLGFAEKGIQPPGGWPDVKPEDGYYKTFMDVEGKLIGPGSFGHMGLAAYRLIVTRVFSAKAATPKSCDTERPRESSTY